MSEVQTAQQAHEAFTLAYYAQSELDAKSVRSAHSDAAHMCDHVALDIRREHTVRGRVTKQGEALAAAIKRAGDAIWALREHVYIASGGRGRSLPPGIDLVAFLRESLMIEGMHRQPTTDELDATEAFLALDQLDVSAVFQLQAVYAPNMPLRSRRSMNVCVGNYIAPQGGPEIVKRLAAVCEQANTGDNPWRVHVEFEKLHAFADGNGRTGRAIWLWQMLRLRQDPYVISFLHRWYYQTLANVDRL